VSVTAETTGAAIAGVTRAEEEELERKTRQKSPGRGGEPTGCRNRRCDEEQRSEDGEEGGRELAATVSCKAEREGGDEVFDDEDREHEIGLPVAEAAKVDEPLDGDRARRDVDAGREHDRCRSEAEGRHTERDPDRAVREQVGATAQGEMAAAAGQSAEAELEPDEEEEEDQAELGDEVRHLGRLDQAEEGGLVWAEDESGEQIGGDRRHSEPVRDQPEAGEEGHGDGELGERHGRTAGCVRGLREPLRARPGTPRRCRRARSSRSGSWRGTAGDTARRSRTRRPGGSQS
jgi:hypothetical protein